MLYTRSNAPCRNIITADTVGWKRRVCILPLATYPSYGSPRSRLRNDMADKSSLVCRNSDRLDSHGLMAALGSGGNVGRKGLRASRARQSLSDPRREPIAIYHVSR